VEGKDSFLKPVLDLFDDLASKFTVGPRSIRSLGYGVPERLALGHGRTKTPLCLARHAALKKSNLMNLESPEQLRLLRQLRFLDFSTRLVKGTRA